MTAIGFRRREADRGAAAVEFALVTPLLLVMLFGIIDYGIWFADSIAARQAVRNVARQASVEQFGSCAAPAGNDLQNAACSVKSQMDQISGTTAVKVSVALTPTSASGAAWKAGATLRICTMTQHQALLPLVPFPNNGITYTRVDMPIETAVGTATRPTYIDPEPSGGSWTQGSWCP
jgi:Flp pilus assembly protein TadG